MQLICDSLRAGDHGSAGHRRRGVSPTRPKRSCVRLARKSPMVDIGQDLAARARFDPKAAERAKPGLARFGSGNIFAQEGSQWLLTEARSGRHGVAGDRCPAIPRSRRLGSGSSCLSITLIHSNALAASRRPRSYAALVARGTPGTPSEHSRAARSQCARLAAAS